MSTPNYTLDDPRENARQFPYTYFLPSDEELAALQPGDLVKLVFRRTRPGEKWDAERMWVIVDEVATDCLTGRLDNVPSDMPGVEAGEVVRFCRYHVISIIWADDRKAPPPDPPVVREYWERCFVDSGVLSGELWVWYLYREAPDMALPDDEHPDSGWRIRGYHQDLTDEELDQRDAQYVAIGAVLNKDDSWLHLIDEPIGSSFIRHSKDEDFVAAD